MPESQAERNLLHITVEQIVTAECQTIPDTWISFNVILNFALKLLELLTLKYRYVQLSKVYHSVLLHFDILTYIIHVYE